MDSIIVMDLIQVGGGNTDLPRHFLCRLRMGKEDVRNVLRCPVMMIFLPLFNYVTSGPPTILPPSSLL